MAYYVLNRNEQSNGDHEVHTSICNHGPSSNYENLGSFSNCHDAVRKAKGLYPGWKINGCWYCSRECHTT